MFVLEGLSIVGFWGTLMSWLRIVVEAEIYVEGSVNGDTVELDDGHSSINPAGN